ncbi:MAG: hypothetical protein R3B90_05325 [Planctomycetaceae bacterium]
MDGRHWCRVVDDWPVPVDRATATRSDTPDAPVAEPPVSLADRLRPLVQDAIAGRASTEQLAQLERSLVSFWRTRRGLNDVPVNRAITELRADPQAGPLITQLEQWLHRPASGEAVDVAQLLQPYRSIDADALEPHRLPQREVPA